MSTQSVRILPSKRPPLIIYSSHCSRLLHKRGSCVSRGFLLPARAQRSRSVHNMVRGARMCVCVRPFFGHGHTHTYSRNMFGNISEMLFVWWQQRGLRDARAQHIIALSVMSLADNVPHSAAGVLQQLYYTSLMRLWHLCARTQTRIRKV